MILIFQDFTEHLQFIQNQVLSKFDKPDDVNNSELILKDESFLTTVKFDLNRIHSRNAWSSID